MFRLVISWSQKNSTQKTGNPNQQCPAPTLIKFTIEPNDRIPNKNNSLKIKTETPRKSKKKMENTPHMTICGMRNVHRKHTQHRNLNKNKELERRKNRMMKGKGKRETGYSYSNYCFEFLSPSLSLCLTSLPEVEPKLVLVYSNFPKREINNWVVKQMQKKRAPWRAGPFIMRQLYTSNPLVFLVFG